MQLLDFSVVGRVATAVGEVAGDKPVPRAAHFRVNSEPSVRIHHWVQWGEDPQVAPADGGVHFHSEGLQLAH